MSLGFHCFLYTVLYTDNALEVADFNGSDARIAAASGFKLSCPDMATFHPDGNQPNLYSCSSVCQSLEKFDDFSSGNSRVIRELAPFY